MNFDKATILASDRLQLSPNVVRGLRLWTLITTDLLVYGLAATLAFALDLAVKTDPLQRAYLQIMRTGAAWHGWGTLFVLVCLLAYFGSRSHYSSRVPFWTEVGTVIGATAVAFTADGIIKLELYGFPFGCEGMMRWVLFVPALLAGRHTARTLLDLCGCWKLRTLMIGDPSAVDCARSALGSEPALGYDIIDTLALDQLGDPDGVASWENVLQSYDAEFVVVAVGQGDFAKERALVAALARAKVLFAIVPAFEGLPVLGFSQHYFFSHDILLLICRNNLARPFSRFAKMLFDQITAAILLLLLSPLFLVIASLVRADGGPAFFGHRRIGANGHTFRCLKFRTMVTNADQILRQVLQSDPDALAEWTETQKLRNDPRVTRVGSFLRKTSLDELPQLINVLRSEMSLVGPRPIVEAETIRYGRDIVYYYETRPGMTGLWQVSGRSDTSYQRRVQLDLWYVKNWTLWHDITILLKTIPVVFGKEGAV